MVDASLIFNLIGKDKATKVLGGVGQAFGKLGRAAASSLDGLSERTDKVATKTGVMTGALGAVGGGLKLVGLEKYEGLLTTAAMGTDLVSGASDLLTLALESERVKQLAGRAATIAHTVAQKGAAAAGRALTAAQWLLNAAMSANPIGLVVVAIVALIAIFVIAYKKSETFRRIVNAAFHGVLSAARATWHWIQRNWPLLLAIITGPIGVAVLAVTRNWNSIKRGAVGVKNGIVSAFNSVVHFIGGLPGRISRSSAGMWLGLYNSFRHAVNSIIGGWNRLSFRIPSIDTHIPGVGRIGGFTLSTPNLPYLARGGLIHRAGFAVVGERGPELVHLDRGAQVSPLRGQGGGPAHIVIDIRGGDQEMRRLIRKWIRTDNLLQDAG